MSTLPLNEIGRFVGRRVNRWRWWTTADLTFLFNTLDSMFPVFCIIIVFGYGQRGRPHQSQRSLEDPPEWRGSAEC